MIWHITKLNGEDMYVSTSEMNSVNDGLRWMLNLPKGSDDRSPNSILIVDQVTEDDVGQNINVASDYPEILG